MISAHKLIKLREAIDRIDLRLLKVLSQRFQLSEKVGQLKAHSGLPVVQKSRKKEILKDREMRGRELGLTGEFIRRLYTLVHLESVNRQLKIKKKSTKKRR